MDQESLNRSARHAADRASGVIADVWLQCCRTGKKYRGGDKADKFADKPVREER